MSSAQLPAPTLTAAERDSIVEAFGGTDAYLEWITGAIEQATEALPVSMKPAIRDAEAAAREHADNV